MITVRRTNELRKASGLVDYLAKGVYGDNKIPCEIGYIESCDTFGNLIALPAYIFISNDGVTEDGTSYYKETINLIDNDTIDVDEEEVQ